MKKLLQSYRDDKHRSHNASNSPCGRLIKLSGIRTAVPRHDSEATQKQLLLSEQTEPKKEKNSTISSEGRKEEGEQELKESRESRSKMKWEVLLIKNRGFLSDAAVLGWRFTGSFLKNEK
ncbi:hypothetical protein ACLOJK_038612 [Asimina triloba]